MTQHWAASLAFILLLSSRGPVVEASTIQWDLTRHQLDPATRKRSDELTWEEVIINKKGRGGYFATVRVGSPAQDLILQLDTASSDVWVPYTGASICDGNTSVGCNLGSYDPEISDTFKQKYPDQFEISYFDQTFADGDYFEDSFEIGGAVVGNLTMGLGLATNNPYGLVGVGYAINEASIATIGKMYPNLPIAMQELGLINSVAYSLWLNDLDASTGSILFGGVDTGKFVGDLIKIAIIPEKDTGEYAHFTVSMSSLEATSPTGTDILASVDSPIEVVLDSGTTLTYLPNEMADRVWEEVGAQYQEIFSMAVLPCSHGIHPGHFTFGFAGPEGPRIDITMDELVVDLTNGNPPIFASGPYEGELVCAFGIQNYSEGPWTLGDTFLRSAYVVYDLENNEIGLAATDFNSTKTEIVAFESKGAKIPSATSGVENDSTAPELPTSTELSAASGLQQEDYDSAGVRACKVATSGAKFLAVGITMVGLMLPNLQSINPHS